MLQSIQALIVRITQFIAADKRQRDSRKRDKQASHLPNGRLGVRDHDVNIWDRMYVHDSKMDGHESIDINAITFQCSSVQLRNIFLAMLAKKLAYHC